MSSLPKPTWAEKEAMHSLVDWFEKNSRDTIDQSAPNAIVTLFIKPDRIFFSHLYSLLNILLPGVKVCPDRYTPGILVFSRCTCLLISEFPQTGNLLWDVHILGDTPKGRVRWVSVYGIDEIKRAAVHRLIHTLNFCNGNIPQDLVIPEAKENPAITRTLNLELD